MIKITNANLESVKTNLSTTSNILMLKYLKSFGFDSNIATKTIDKLLNINDFDDKSEEVSIGFMIGNNGISNQTVEMEIIPMANNNPHIVELPDEIMVTPDDKFISEPLPIKYSDLYSEFENEYCFAKNSHINGEFFRKYFGKFSDISHELIPNKTTGNMVNHTFIRCNLTRDEIVAKTSSSSGCRNNTNDFNEICLFFGTKIRKYTSRIVNGRRKAYYEILNAVPFYKLEFSPINVSDISDSGIQFVFDLYDDI